LHLQERKELITLGNRALGASTRLAQYLDEAAKTWRSKRGTSANVARTRNATNQNRELLNLEP
jgi:hypothetical protein